MRSLFLNFAHHPPKSGHDPLIHGGQFAAGTKGGLETGKTVRYTAVRYTAVRYTAAVRPSGDRNSVSCLDFTERIGILAVATFALRDLFAVHRDLARGLDADSHLCSAHRHDGDFNVVANTQCLTGSSGQYQHRFASLLGG